MDIERVRKLIQNPSCTRQELEQLLKGALAANERELAYDIRDVIEDRFPVVDRSRGGGTETIARLGTESRDFPTAKQAYVWIIEGFVKLRPDVFTDIKWETTGYIGVGLRRTDKAAIRNYFARSPSKLFRASPHLAEDQNNYLRLSNGWYANVNLNNGEKFDILCRFGWVVGLKCGADWDWEVLDPSERLRDTMERIALGERLFAELESLDAGGQRTEI